MTRSLKKGPYVDERLLEKLSRVMRGSKTVVNTWSRRATITPEMVGFTIGVHNGKIFNQVFIMEEMVGMKLGEFSPTRKFVRHGGKMQKELELKAAESAKAAEQKVASPAPEKK
ncbi:MAG: 30S ribosomal protein S19 [Patescibacteria group bacterium]